MMAYCIGAYTVLGLVSAHTACLKRHVGSSQNYRVIFKGPFIRVLGT